MDNNLIDPMLTTSEVARILNVHINTIRRWSNQGILKAYRIGSRGDRRFKKTDIDDFFSRDGKSLSRIADANPEVVVGRGVDNG